MKWLQALFALIFIASTIYAAFMMWYPLGWLAIAGWSMATFVVLGEMKGAT